MPTADGRFKGIAVPRAFEMVDVIVCPIHWAGYTRDLEDGRRVFACGACPDPEGCADAGSCERYEAVQS